MLHTCQCFRFLSVQLIGTCCYSQFRLGWCCEHRNIACGVHQKLPSPYAGNPGVTEVFILPPVVHQLEIHGMTPEDCDLGQPDAWGEGKTSWCCREAYITGRFSVGFEVEAGAKWQRFSFCLFGAPQLTDISSLIALSWFTRSPICMTGWCRKDWFDNFPWSPEIEFVSSPYAWVELTLLKHVSWITTVYQTRSSKKCSKIVACNFTQTHSQIRYIPTYPDPPLIYVIWSSKKIISIPSTSSSR